MSSEFDTMWSELKMIGIYGSILLILIFIPIYIDATDGYHDETIITNHTGIVENAVKDNDILFDDYNLVVNESGVLVSKSVSYDTFLTHPIGSVYKWKTYDTITVPDNEIMNTSTP
jgi:hypothetical protein